jgi:hypothetical protein
MNARAGATGRWARAAVLMACTLPLAPLGVAGQVTDTTMVPDTSGLVRALTLSPEIVGQLETLTTSAFDTPYAMGLIPTGMVEAALASEYVSIAGSDSLDVRRMTGNMTHVLHAIDPTLVASGLGLGYGFRRAAEGVRNAITLAASAPGASDVLLYHASFIEEAATGAMAKADDAVALARTIRSSTDPETIRPLLDRLARLVRAMAYGEDADGDGRIGSTGAEAGLAQAAYHLSLVRRVEQLPPAPPLPAALPLPDGLVVPGYAHASPGRDQ